MFISLVAGNDLYQYSDVFLGTKNTPIPRDTVSSIGLHRRTLPLAESMEHVCFFRHALALDERRVKFMPEYVNPHGPPNNERKMAFIPPELSEGFRSQVLPHIKEVWFPGTHSDV